MRSVADVERPGESAPARGSARGPAVPSPAADRAMPTAPRSSRPEGPPPAADLPTVSPRLFAAFARYARWYLRRHFHAVRLAASVPAVPAVPPDAALVVYLNHPSWWDPLLALTLAATHFPERTHHGPIDAAMLERYGFFRRLGFFGVEPGTVAGARRFLRLADALLARPGTALWITPQGEFTDPRRRPVRLRPGLGRAARRLVDRPGGAVLLPLAVEYPFWEERFPEALVAYGEPVDADHLAGELGGGASPADWDRALAARLETAQDCLAALAQGRDPGSFHTLVGGRAGVGGVYDLWRAARALVTGERFVREHRGREP